MALEQPQRLTLSDGDGLADGQRTLLISDTDFKNDKDVIHYIDSFYRDGKNRKLSYERNWYETIEMLVGNQWSTYDEAERRFRPNVKPAHRVRYTGNHLSAYIMTRRAKILREDPFIRVNPATNQPEDYDVAEISTKILRYLWDINGLQGLVLPSVATWLLVSGTGIIKVFFDPDRGPRVSLQAADLHGVDSDLVRGAFGEERDDISSSRDIYLGEAAAESVSPFWVFPDPQAEHWEECGKLLDVRRRSLDWIRENYPRKGRDVNEEGRFGIREYYEQRLKDMQGGSVSGLAAGGASESGLPSALVKELWVKPSRDYPDGIYVVVANNVVLHNSGLPEWCEGSLPYFACVDKEIPTRIWGQATADDIKPINKLRNRAMSQIVENANLTGNPRVLLPIGCRVQPNSLKNKPGEVIPYVDLGGVRPSYLMPPPLPRHVQDLPDKLLEDIMMVSGLNEPTFRSAAPTGVRTSSGLAQLIKEDDTRLGVIIKSFYRMLSLVGGMLLKVVAYEYDDNRLGRVLGDHNNFDVFHFKGKDLLGRNVNLPGANYFDVRISTDTGHRSKAAQQEFLMNAASVGLVNLQDPIERRWLLRMLDIGAPDDSLFGDLRLTEAQAKIEDRFMAQASDEEWEIISITNSIGPHPWDVDEDHLKCHTEFMRRPDFLKLLETHPERALRFQKHVMDHERAVVDKQMKAAMGAATGGGLAPQAMPPQGQEGSGMPSPPSPRMSMSRPGVPQMPVI
jgi:hypothetical protein